MRDLRRAIEACVRAGLVYEPGRKHHKIVDPVTGKHVVVSSTPRCPHAYKNVLHDVKKYLGRDIKLHD